jgi:hypothetical protein
MMTPHRAHASRRADCPRSPASKDGNRKNNLDHRKVDENLKIKHIHTSILLNSTQQQNILRDHFYAALVEKKIPKDTALIVVDAYARKKIIPTGTDRDSIVSAIVLAFNLGLEQSSISNQQRVNPLNNQSNYQLPGQAPELYVPKQGVKKSERENVIGFLARVWGPWIAAGVLTRPALRRLDRKAYNLLISYLQNHDLPEGWKIPSKSETLRFNHKHSL